LYIELAARLKIQNYYSTLQQLLANSFPKHSHFPGGSLIDYRQTNFKSLSIVENSLLPKTVARQQVGDYVFYSLQKNCAIT